MHRADQEKELDGIAKMNPFKYLGPSLDKGPLPAVFYFALSAEDTLYVDPFNQPALALLPFNCRIFSLTLPGHDSLPPKEALNYWTEQIVQDFVSHAHRVIETLIQDGVIDKKKLAVMGLSRGVFIACHVAAITPAVSHILGFAPLTHLSVGKEWGKAPHSSLMGTLNNLANRNIRFYIGNNDTRVGTKACFDFFSHLVQTAAEKKIRPIPMELFMTPSIGHQGHGTSPETFQSGAQWLGHKLGNL